MTEPVITAIYDMPYAPDDYFYYEKSVRKLYRSGAQRAAEKFGQTEAALDVGHAYGQNIVTGFNETPTLDLAPVYIRLAGIEGAFLLDAASYAWGPEGMVVSSDLMLLGVTGYDGLVPPATSWLRLPAAPSAIGPAGATTIEASPVKANSINIPSGFDARNPAAVLASLPTDGVDVFREWRANTVVLPPALVLEQFIVTAGPYLAVREFEYGLVLEPETAAIAAGPVAEYEDDGDPAGTDVPLADIVYSQSTVYTDNTPADVETMQDGEIGGTATGTDYESGELSWIQMDLGDAYDIDRLIIGTATTDMPGGWSKAYTENCDIEFSLNGTTWTTYGTTGTFADEGIYELPVDFTARYVRISVLEDYLALSELYALAVGQPLPPVIESADLATGPAAQADEYGPGDPYVVSGTAAPILGDVQVSPTSVATDAGWDLVLSVGTDEGFAALGTDIGFTFDDVAYAFVDLNVNANSYIIFGSNSNVSSGFGAGNPARPKILIGSDDFSVQRIYQKIESDVYRIRWEGNSNPSDTSGNSNRVWEAAFYAPLADGVQFVEIRSGDIDGSTSGPFMIATATTALASGSFAANQSWVYRGNADGTIWTLYTGAHVDILAT